MQVKEIINEASLNKLHNKSEYKRALDGFEQYFDTPEKAKQRLDHYSRVVDELIAQGGDVYRAVWVIPGTTPNLEDPGNHWTLTVELAKEYLDSNAGWSAYADLKSDHPDETPVAHIIQATVGPNNITNKNVLICSFPEEQEVSIVNTKLAKMKLIG